MFQKSTAKRAKSVKAATDTGAKAAVIKMLARKKHKKKATQKVPQALKMQQVLPSPHVPACGLPHCPCSLTWIQ